MNLTGWLPTTLIDYPGRVAATLFASGCNFRCPFCHNPELVRPERVASLPILDEEEILSDLARRRGFLDGVVLTGGEPTLQRDLVAFAGRLKEMGYLVKLDTNGSHPAVVQTLIDGGLADYVAVDIKGPPDRYAEFAGVGANTEDVRQTVRIVTDGPIDYELRTTVAPGLTASDIEEIADWVRPAKRYVLQAFRVPPEATKTLLDPSWAVRDALGEAELRATWATLSERFEDGGVRA
ncbi:MAG: anaerobic ribonucleoside-triphosphate reductase activating protein [Candidatus Bipolaricaulia bacterium]